MLLWSAAPLAASVSVVVGRIGWSDALPAYVLFVAAGTLLAGIDATTHRVPDIILVPASVVGAILLCIASAVEGDGMSVLRAGIGSTALITFFLALLVVSRNGIGLGDVKLAAFVGMYLAWLGWRTLAFGTLSAFLLALVGTAPLLVARRIERCTRIPFAPFMFAGAIIAIVLSAR